MSKRFQLVLDDESYERFQKYYFGYGIRQTVLRRAVRELIERAEKKYQETKQVITTEDDLL
jgi:hypothetical protein